jgi:hypothetical protein
MEEVSCRTSWWHTRRQNIAASNTSPELDRKSGRLPAMTAFIASVIIVLRNGDSVIKKSEAIGSKWYHKVPSCSIILNYQITRGSLDQVSRGKKLLGDRNSTVVKER